MRRIRSAEMVGRGSELSRLLDAAGRARAGEVTVALVAGEAGIGKTRLLQEMAARLEGTDLVLVGHGVDLETGELPFGVLGETLRNLVRQVGMEHVVRAVDEAGASVLAALLPVLDGDRHVGSTNQATNRLAMLSSALTLFETLARERTLCWLVEDLQWVDASTRDVLSLLCRTVSDVRLLVVGSVRTDDPEVGSDAGSYVAALSRLPHAEVITLRRLDPHDVHDQLTGIVGVAVSPGVVERVVELSDGVPFLVEELAATGGRPDLVTVAAMTEGRLSRLGTESRRLVEAAAIGEGHLDGSLVELVLGVEPDRYDAALREAVSAGILEDPAHGESLRFRHALIRRAVDEGVLPGARRSWHARWADMLKARARSPADPLLISVAQHRFQSGGDPDAVFDSLLSGAEAARRIDSAADLATILNRLLGLWDAVTQPEERATMSRRDILLEAVDASNASGGPAQVLSLVDRELMVAPAADVVARAWLELVRWAVQSPQTFGRMTLPLRPIRHYADVFLAAPTDRMAVHGLLFVAQGSLADPTASEGFLQECRRRSQGFQDDRLEVAIHLISARVLTALGRPEESTRALEEWLSQESQRPAHSLWGPDGDLMWQLAIQGRYAEADQAWRRASTRVKDARVAVALWEHVVENIVWVWTATGQWDEAEELLGRSRAYLDDELHLLDIRADTLQLLRTGRVERAAAWRDSLGTHDRAAPTQAQRHQLLALLAAVEGDLAGARAHYQWMWELPHPEWGTEELFEPVLHAMRSEAGAQADNPDESAQAERHVTQVLQVASRIHSFGALGPAIHAELAAQTARFRNEPSRALFETALAAWQAIGQPYDAALCRLRLAESCLTDGERDIASAYLDAAHATAQRLRAQPLLDEINTLSRRAGLRGSFRQTGSGRVLTAREHEVLVHLAAGRTNNQIAAELFISPKTASVHVSRIIAKLGAANRTEAAAIAQRENFLDH